MFKKQLEFPNFIKKKKIYIYIYIYIYIKNIDIVLSFLASLTQSDLLNISF